MGGFMNGAFLPAGSGGGASGMGSAGAASDIVGGAMQIFSGLSDEEGLFAQGTRYRQQAQLDLYQGGQEVQQKEQAGVRALSGAAAGAGASGITMSGSPAQAQKETITQTNMSDAASRFSAKVKNVQDLYEANVQDYAGKQAFFGGLMSGAMSMVQGAALLAV